MVVVCKIHFSSYSDHIFLVYRMQLTACQLIQSDDKQTKKLETSRGRCTLHEISILIVVIVSIGSTRTVGTLSSRLHSFNQKYVLKFGHQKTACAIAQCISRWHSFVNMCVCGNQTHLHILLFVVFVMTCD